ncbi:TetR/AcrR family transcriptional regulator [Nocardia huaxiensis]|uniref:TetR/AcrR family transcriptional regulator n=1 Tax=Nocardia huaxiensis TaxID=2755382 RepID=A0A7D6ZKE6_9NOCA|nr:TetR/AcrR family transcriptional regulator [Nocardia huaxiensis]QLY29703.1 TetR/AcrR family transcriptional regulator [Nocardia huaxiensis]UFS96721.1 TetR/AcrR family transcriptional regulator [Nocardia huaxiensis]
MLGETTRDRKAERREATRQEILDAAWALVREHGLAQLTLRAVATRVGMRAPSLYSHFASKNAIYDAMFGAAWLEFERETEQRYATLPSEPRARAKAMARTFFDFSVADLARYQLMNQRTIPGFEPSPEAFAPSERVVRKVVGLFADLGATERGDVEIAFALIGGLVDQQLANDPGGDSRRVLLDRAVDMWADGVGLAPVAEPPARRRKRK